MRQAGSSQLRHTASARRPAVTATQASTGSHSGAATWRSAKSTQPPAKAHSAEGLRDFVAHHVAQHAAKDAGGHAHHHGHQRGHAQGAGQVGAHGGKQAQADGVGPLHGALGGLDVVLAHEHHGRQRQRQNAPDKFNVPHPEKGALVQQHIAQRAAAKRGQKTHHAHAHHIQPLARRHDDPREGKSRSGNELQHQPQRIDQGGTQNFHGAMVACW